MEKCTRCDSSAPIRLRAEFVRDVRKKTRAPKGKDVGIPDARDIEETLK